MKKIILFIIVLSILTQFSCHRIQKIDKKLNASLMLWYDKPASRWTDALPLGNGRLGAMVFGKTANEIIQFNEETLWSGQPHDYSNKGANEVLEQMRELLWDGKQDKAHELGNQRFMSQPFGQMSYQPFGNIILNFPGHENTINYNRRLDLEDAISSVNYEVDQVKFKREIFASNPDQSIVINLTSSKKEAINFTVSLNSPHVKYNVTVLGNEIVLRGKSNNYHLELDASNNPYPESKVIFEARLKVIHDGGELKVRKDKIEIKNATSATLYLVAATNFINYKDISGDPTEICNNYLKNLNGKSYKEIKEKHIKDFQKLMNRVKLDLGESKISKRPTDKRLISFKQDEDPSLVSLLYQYGRYLLISSSRSGSQPANLQGIWNDRLNPPWDSKYTININTEMNYWLAETTNLSEMADPLIQMVEDLAITGQNVAKEHYNLDGWVAHHNTDLWRGAAPINHANHGIWPTGGAWLSQHLWWHYQFTGDKVFLKNKAYPVLKEASIFFSGYLVPDRDNPKWLVSGPSNSPENRGLVMAPTMDHQIIRNLFSNTIEASDILEMDADFANMLKKKRAKIAPNKIGKYGQLQEWLEDIDDPKSEHRHVSHLWGLHPGNEIHPLITPDLAEACKVTLKHRGDEGTGWSRAWKINFWARLLDGDHSFLLLKNLMVPSRTQDIKMKDKGGLYLNLFDAHPPFQIDGNFGATSGITEMLLQSHLRDENGNYIQDILPALPTALESGKISGIKGRGAFELDMVWQYGKLVLVKVLSLEGNHLNLRYNGVLISKITKKGELYSFNLLDFK